MAAFSISLKAVSAKATAAMGQHGKQTPAHSGSDQGDVAVRLAGAAPASKPRVRPGGGVRPVAPRPIRRPVGNLGSGRAGGNPRAVKSLAGRSPSARPKGSRQEGARPSGITAVRIASGTRIGGSRGGRGLLGAGGVNQGRRAPPALGVSLGHPRGGMGARRGLGGGQGMPRKVGLLGGKSPAAGRARQGVLGKGMLGRKAVTAKGGGVGQGAGKRAGGLQRKPAGSTSRYGVGAAGGLRPAGARHKLY